MKENMYALSNAVRFIVKYFSHKIINETPPNDLTELNEEFGGI